MKNVLYVLNDGFRKFTYPRTAGLYRAIQSSEEPINLFIVRSNGYSGFSQEHNTGEYNIFRLPDYADFDGIFLDINSNFTADTNAEGARGALYAAKAALESGKPVISMANAIEGCYYVGIDNYDAMTSMIRHLHGEMGLTDFWFAMGPEDNYENGIRTRAIRDYCQAHGLPCGEERFYFESFIMECGAHAFESLYAARGGLCQAVICANDQIAAGVCQAAKAAGFDVPDDLKVTGFDNLEFSAYNMPSITTVDQLCWTMGETCVDAMCRIWRGEDVPRVIHTPTQLLLRQSTGHQDPMPENMKRKISAFITRDSAANEFSYRLSTLQYKLPGCNSIESICRALTECLYAAGCKGISLVLDRELYEYGRQIDMDERAWRIRGIGDHMAVKGYSDTMEQVYAWEAGKPPRFRHRRVKGRLSVSGVQGPRENHLYVPLHFMEHTIGYLVIWECLELMRIRYVSSVVNTLTMALHSFFVRRKMTAVNQMLSGISMKDDLTGLHNRMGYQNLGERLYREVNEADGRLGVMFMDMDKLKHINDNYGHASGDQAICCIANAIRRTLPKRSVAMRFGGDEFLALAPLDDEDALRALAEALEDAIPREAAAMGLEEAPGISIGWVLTDPESDRPLSEWVEEADARMYQVKKTRGMQR